MSFREEFPDYPVDSFPTIPPSFEDASWHNDACPSIVSGAMGLLVWIDYPDPTKREHGGDRYTVCRHVDGEGSGDEIHSGNEWRGVLVALLAERFAATLREWLTPAQFAEMKAKNESPEYAGDQVCASHDYCDANMAMDAAFNKVLGRSPRTEEEDRAGAEEDIRLWNEAWTLARKKRIGVGK